MNVLRLKIKYPSSFVPSFITKKDEIQTVKEKYNIKHPNEKIYYIIISDKYMDIFIEVNDKNSIVDGHQIAFFSKELYNSFGWSTYSNKANKLFKTTLLNCILLKS